jgi:hypothetical protein
VIGVVSASVMDGSEQTLGLTEFTRLDHWRRLFANARLIAEGTSPAELPPVDCVATDDAQGRKLGLDTSL